MFPANQEVFSCGPSGGVTLNVLPGQFVMYDPRTNVSLPATTTPSDASRVVLGVGVDTNGDGAANTLRKCFGEQLYGDFINAATAEPPRCGVANIYDLLFKCTDCAVTYTMQVNVEDDSSQNQYPYNRPSSYVFSVTTECCDCDTCTSGHAASDLACKMVDTINNGIVGTDPTKISTFKKQISQELPFYAVRLFGGTDASQVYCLTPNADACGNGCTTVDGIKGIRVDFGSGPTTVTFNNTINPGDSTTTLQAQLANVVSEINRVLDGNGSATITKGAGDCCTYQLEINSCATEAVLIDHADADMVPCSTGNPLAPVDFNETCKNCGSGTESVTFESGIRIIAKAVDLNCNCEFPPNPPTGYFGRKLNVFASEGWECGSTYVRELQPMVLPQNLGYQWQWREYTTDFGGQGRGHNPYNDQYGPIRLPGPQDRASSTQANCRESYCTYILEHGLPHTNNGVSAPFRTARGRTVILVPNGDTTTKTELETALNAYIRGDAMPNAKATITCDSDQDQTENDSQTGFPEGLAYPNANGYLV